jgi:hypothetical protein
MRDFAAIERELIAALKALGPGFHTRQDIATITHKKQMDAVSRGVLDDMAARGIVLRENRPGKRPGANQYHYRLDMRRKEAK